MPKYKTSKLIFSNKKLYDIILKSDNMKEEYFEITNESGEKVLCQMLYAFENNNENYIIYTDFEVDSNSELNVLSSKYKIENGNLILEPIKSQEEWDLIDKVWKEHQND